MIENYDWPSELKSFLFNRQIQINNNIVESVSSLYVLKVPYIETHNHVFVLISSNYNDYIDSREYILSNREQTH